MRRAWWGCFAGVMGGVIWLASCVSNDTNGITPGEDGGACLSNNTCDNGLTCELENGRGICVPSVDAGSDAASDVITSDATPDVTTDAHPDATCPTETINFAAPCVDASASAYFRIDASIVTCGLSDPSPGNDFVVNCDDRGPITNFYCCLTGTAQFVDAGCATDLALTFANQLAVTYQGCSTTQRIVCSSDARCAFAAEAGTPVSKCVPIDLKGVPSFDGSVIGICE